jgi:hypothetical protein
MTDEHETDAIDIESTPPPPPDGPPPAVVWHAPLEVVLEVQYERRKTRIPLDFDHTALLVGRGDADTPVDVDLTGPNDASGGVSRQHALLTLRSDGIYIEDMASTNGTRINGFTLLTNQQYRLRNSDEIEFGQLRTVIRFRR